MFFFRPDKLALLRALRRVQLVTEEHQRMAPSQVAVVIPCYKVREQIADVLAGIGAEVSRVYVVDDCCPQKTGEFVEQNFDPERFVVLRNEINQGVGGATVTGYRRALEDGMDIVVKMDGDGQMSGVSISHLVSPIRRGVADYAKGNRFYNLSYLRPMPLLRLIGNCGLSFVSKLSGGYWNIMDPTNGFTAIHATVLGALDLDKIEKRYFFESDMLYRLYLLRVVIWDVPIPARYGNEKSNLVLHKALFEFSYKHLVRFCKRIFYSYFLRDFQIGSLMLLAGFALACFGVSFGGYHWYIGIQTQVLTAHGTIMFAALTTLMGLQLLLTFLSCDMSNVPSRPVHPLLNTRPTPEDVKN